MCEEEFFTEHSTVEGETITLSLETSVTNHSVTRRTIPEKQRALPHRSESLKTRIFTCVQKSKKRLSLNRVALRETKFQVDGDDGDDDGNDG